jgi:monofunctional biosynthetic peptidoglycan transglycosylase
MKIVLRLFMLVLLALLVLQLYFAGRILFMRWVNPESTSFQRAEAYRLVRSTGQLLWRQEWVPYAQISDSLKRAVIASEDAGFTEHDGVDLEALEKAWEKNQKAEQEAARKAEQARRRAGQRGGAPTASRPTPPPEPKIVGGSTITQQLAKNLFLSGERTLARKAQELALTLMLETLLSKQRILEIYLNTVEWGEGVFGAQAAAQHYYRKPAARLSAYEAARLAVMLPRPRYFEKRSQSQYLAARAMTITARMPAVDLP